MRQRMVTRIKLRIGVPSWDFLKKSQHRMSEFGREVPERAIIEAMTGLARTVRTRATADRLKEPGRAIQ
jgi:hypothetical protein